MKLFKNPVFAVIFCLLLIVCSVFLTRFRMEREYDRLCSNLYDEIVEFAEENGLGALKSDAHAAAASEDYASLVTAYSAYSLGNYHDTDDVDDAIRSYTKFMRSTHRFPASFFVDLFDLSF